MDVYFTNFLKKQNSVAQPNLGSLSPNDCKLKAPCSVLHPVLELYAADITTYESVIQTNYAYIPDFHRYYFITNWTFNANILICSLEVDVLATYRAAIKGSTMYVVRSASTYDGNINDGKYPLKSIAPQKSKISVNNPLQPAATDYGCFVVGVINKNISLSGCVSYYVMSYLVFYTYCQKLFTLSSQWGSSDTSVSDGVKKAITDPFQYLVSVTWFPYSTADFSSRSLVTAVSTIPTGYDNISITGTAYEFDSSILNVQFTNLIQFTIPKHPDAASRGGYLNVAPYSRYYLSFYPFCGEIELDAMALQGNTILDLVYTVDLRTGKGILSICTEYAGTDWQTWQPVAPFRVLEAQVGVSIPTASIHTVLPASLGQMARNAAVATASEFSGFKEFGLSVYSTIAKGVGQLLGMNEDELSQMYDEIGAEPIQKGDLSNIATNAAAMTSTSELIGSQGTIAFYNRMPLQFWCMFYQTTEDANATYGRPLCRTMQLTNLTGFTQCGNPHFTAPVGAYKSEVTLVENYLATGVILD